jgi:hypothetical protein
MELKLKDASLSLSNFETFIIILVVLIIIILIISNPNLQNTLVLLFSYVYFRPQLRSTIRQS